VKSEAIRSGQSWLIRNADPNIILKKAQANEITSDLSGILHAHAGTSTAKDTRSPNAGRVLPPGLQCVGIFILDLVPVSVGRLDVS
jgi:hypothetical protein